jgi:anti-sigma regulatory factor (Ser/Thr protein kinase)
MDVTLTPLPSRLPGLRRSAERELLRVPGDVAGDVLLALDEAVGNAIRHGSRGGRPVQVTLQVDQDWVHMTVRDHGPTAELPCLPAGPPPTLADGGRGLWLISQLVDEVRLERAGRGTLLSLRRRAEPRIAAGARRG